MRLFPNIWSVPPFLRNYYPSLHSDFVLHSDLETWPCTYFISITFSPISLLATTKAFVVLMACTLPPKSWYHQHKLEADVYHLFQAILICLNPLNGLLYSCIAFIWNNLICCGTIIWNYLICCGTVIWNNLICCSTIIWNYLICCSNVTKSIRCHEWLTSKQFSISVRRSHSLVLVKSATCSFKCILYGGCAISIEDLAQANSCNVGWSVWDSCWTKWH